MAFSKQGLNETKQVVCLLANKCRKCLTIRVEILRYSFAELQTISADSYC